MRPAAPKSTLPPGCRSIRCSCWRWMTLAAKCSM
ncbi:hypothetical protein GBP88_02435 [Mycobacterium avium subsp. hominissuis]|nr:hypothetical protein [Mycobacterium avium subsp. hominissuis]RIR56054.1 hypothetical protein D2E61_11575 [Mycobacteroides abscessus]TVX94953.1 hypothetical protein FPV58_29270 [Mycolicibacterium porcinum]TXA42990.1 hypothetical protein DKM27_04910 [Mycobacterium tuberculosis variant bovis]MBZ4508533.1 hypothetical protein [Mycobacterium avium subsp. hominissuis]